MALTVVFALIGSLILSLTLIPALAALLLPKKMSHSEPLLVRLAVWIYKPILKLVLRFRIAAILMVVGVSLVAIMMARSLGSEFIPKLSEGAIVINIFRPVGTSIQEAVRYNTKLEKMVLAAFPDEVKGFGAGWVHRKLQPTRWALKKPIFSSPSTPARNGARQGHKKN